jgi:hypothetical protein
LRRYLHLIYIHGERSDRRFRCFDQYFDQYNQHSQHNRLERIAGCRCLEQFYRHDHVGGFKRPQRQHQYHEWFNQLESLQHFGQFVRKQYNSRCELQSRSCGGAGG